jgi:uncharacterized membrane protein
LLLVLPGYSITAAIFGRRPQRPVETTLLTLGLSLSFDALATLALGLWPGAQRGSVWAVVAGAVVVVCVAVAARRRAGSAMPPRVLDHRRVRPRDAALFAAALLLASAAVVAARWPLPAPSAQGYTALAMLPVNGAAVRVQVTSSEQTTHTYRLEVRVSDTTLARRRVTLAPGESADIAVGVSAEHLRARTTRIDALLYRTDRAGGPYRAVHVFLRR